MQQSYSTAASSVNLYSALDKIKAVFDSIPNDEADISVYGKCFLISQQQGQGLQWNELPKTLAKLNLLVLSAEKLELHSLKKVCTYMLTIIIVIIIFFYTVAFNGRISKQGF